MKVLITSPSLNESENVSGISTVVRQIIERGAVTYTHFRAGRRDGEAVGSGWVLGQGALPFRFWNEIRRSHAEVVHINTALTQLSIARDAALVRAARLARRPVVLAVHGGRYLVEEFRNPALKAVASGMLNGARVVLVLSEFEKAEVDRRWPDLDVRVLPNAVPRVEIVRQRNGPRPVVAFLGRLHESKGLDEIEAAVRELKARGFSFAFRAYGEGPKREIFVSEMLEILGSDFDYRGVVSGNDKWAALSEADILVLPSRYGEGLPMSMLEAMAAGCVVVAGDVASVSSVIENGVNGFTVRPGDAADLTRTLGDLLSEPARWAAIGERAAAVVRERFDITDYIARIEDIYREVAT